MRWPWMMRLTRSWLLRKNQLADFQRWCTLSVSREQWLFTQMETADPPNYLLPLATVELLTASPLIMVNSKHTVPPWVMCTMACFHKASLSNAIKQLLLPPRVWWTAKNLLILVRAILAKSLLTHSIRITHGWHSLYLKITKKWPEYVVLLKYIAYRLPSGPTSSGDYRFRF